MTPDTNEAKYRAIPELSPYVRKDRYQILKEDHKFYAAHLKETIDTSKTYDVGDIGCGNGELVYALMRFYPHWHYAGYDFTQEFIDTAKAFEGLKAARFARADMFDVKEQFDVVLCSSVVQIFPDVEKTLAKLLEITRPGGWIFADGLFNKWDVEVEIKYCDNSNPRSAGKWRQDWSQHSRKRVSAFLKSQNVKSHRFDDVIMDLDMKPNPDVHINRFTFRDSGGRNVITNGTNILLNRTLLTIQK